MLITIKIPQRNHKDRLEKSAILKLEKEKYRNMDSENI
jgi:hypothetical protein